MRYLVNPVKEYVKGQAIKLGVYAAGLVVTGVVGYCLGHRVGEVNGVVKTMKATHEVLLNIADENGVAHIGGLC